jgi:hypothetical protein
MIETLFKLSISAFLWSISILALILGFVILVGLVLEVWRGIKERKR